MMTYNTKDAYNLIEDLVVLTTIPRSSFDKLNDKCQYIICHAIEEAIENGKDTVEINIGFGTILIKIEQDAIKYRFSPTQSLNNNVKNTIKTHKSPLVDRIETLLKERICNARKDLL